MKPLFLLFLCVGWLGCSGAQAPSKQRARAADTITVEGQVSVRGNMPFTVVMLETDQRLYYVLALDEAERQTLEGGLPARFRVTGTLYADDWGGRPFAHLKPTAIERL